MKVKASCEECGHVHTATALHRSVGDFRYLCYNCWRRDMKERNKLKIRILTKKDKELAKSIPISKKSSIAHRMLKYGVELFKGEEKL